MKKTLTFPALSIDVSELKRDNIVLDRFLRFGDVVVMHKDEEARGYGPKDVLDGTVGIVVGFKRFVDYKARIHNFGGVPGMYERNGVAAVAWSDGSNSSPGASALRFFENNKKKQDERRKDVAANDAFEFEFRIGDLPELPIWEQDIVEIVSPRIQRSWDCELLVVQQILYHHINDKRQDGTPMPLYQVTKTEPGYGSMTLDDTEIRLKERGNVWKWFNGQKDQIVFKDIQNEVAFHFALGKYEQIKCDSSGNYDWPQEAVLPAAQADLIDVMKREPGFFGSTGIVAGYKLTDPDLSERARTELIKGFSSPIQA